MDDCVWNTDDCDTDDVGNASAEEIQPVYDAYVKVGKKIAAGEASVVEEKKATASVVEKKKASVEDNKVVVGPEEMGKVKAFLKEQVKRLKGKGAGPERIGPVYEAYLQVKAAKPGEALSLHPSHVPSDMRTIVPDERDALMARKAALKAKIRALKASGAPESRIQPVYAKYVAVNKALSDLDAEAPASTSSTPSASTPSASAPIAPESASASASASAVVSTLSLDIGDISSDSEDDSEDDHDDDHDDDHSQLPGPLTLARDDPFIFSESDDEPGVVIRERKQVMNVMDVPSLSSTDSENEDDEMGGLVYVRGLKGTPEGSRTQVHCVLGSDGVYVYRVKRKGGVGDLVECIRFVEAMRATDTRGAAGGDDERVCVRFGRELRSRIIFEQFTGDARASAVLGLDDVALAIDGGVGRALERARKRLRFSAPPAPFTGSVLRVDWVSVRRRSGEGQPVWLVCVMGDAFINLYSRIPQSPDELDEMDPHKVTGLSVRLSRHSSARNVHNEVYLHAGSPLTHPQLLEGGGGGEGGSEEGEGGGGDTLSDDGSTSCEAPFVAKLGFASEGMMKRWFKMGKAMSFSVLEESLRAGYLSFPGEDIESGDPLRLVFASEVTLASSTSHLVSLRVYAAESEYTGVWSLLDSEAIPVHSWLIHHTIASLRISPHLSGPGTDSFVLSLQFVKGKDESVFRVVCPEAFAVFNVFHKVRHMINGMLR